MPRKIYLPSLFNVRCLTLFYSTVLITVQTEVFDVTWRSVAFKFSPARTSFHLQRGGMFKLHDTETPVLVRLKGNDLVLFQENMRFYDMTADNGFFPTR